jgi:hypothetical protein
MIPAPLRHPLTALRNVTVALCLVLARAVKGKRILATEETRMARITACASCPHREDAFCGVCTCLIEPKASLQSETCPKALWQE